jgi:hypothetical protein
VDAGRHYLCGLPLRPRNHAAILAVSTFTVREPIKGPDVAQIGRRKEAEENEQCSETSADRRDHPW